ncbi:phenoloxidase-activating factor 3-like isoform X3 [Argiope bruennichi]|nr:phenoloxidase-activating factor 3-like isoform X3 [Argiope bruennichi]
MVAVYLGYFFHCGGSLITRQYVLTSASCLKMNGSISVGIAVHNWAWPHQRIAASEVKIHPNYKRKESSYDVGLIKLSKAVTISERVRPLCLPQNVEYERPGRHAIAAGWGETKSAQTDGSQGSLVNQYLKEIESRIVNTNDSIITAVGVNGRGVCYGDSGSPLFTRYADGKFHVIGVISRGPSNCSGPFLSPRISPINQWIRRNVMDSEPCEKAIYQIKPNDTSYM